MESRVSANEDYISQYLNEAGRYELLDKQQEFELGVKIQNGIAADDLLKTELSEEHLLPEERVEALEAAIAQGKVAEEAMINANLRLVVSLAKRRTKSGKVELLDAIQFGNIGLMTAVKKFDPYKGFKFSTYATWWIKQAIGRGLVDSADTIRFPTKTHDEIAAIKRARSILLDEGFHQPTNEQIAELTNIPAERVETASVLVKNLANVISLNDGLSDTETAKGTKEFVDIFPDKSSTEPYETTENNIVMEQIVKELYKRLDRRSADIIYHRYLADETVTLERLGEQYGLTRERIRQLERVAMSKLKHSTLLSSLSELIGSPDIYEDE